MKILSFSVLASFFLSAATAQGVRPNFDSIARCMCDSIHAIESISFSATMHTKKFSDEKFDERRFDVFARRNPDNKGYNFDWEIIEYGNDYELRYVFVGNEFFFINRINKGIGYNNNLRVLPSGNYFETMRWSTLFDEFIYDFDSLYSIEQVASIYNMQDGSTQIIIQINDIEDRILTIDADNCLPIKSKNIVRYKELNLTQVIETKLSNIQINSFLPDSILSPQFYINQEYAVKHQNQNSEKEIEHRRVLSNSDINVLLTTPLISSKGDTTRLQDISGNLFLIDFWYMSCIPCLKSMPYLQELSEKYKDNNLKVIGINCYDDKNAGNVVAKLKENGIVYDNFFADKYLVQQLGIRAFPTFLIIDKERAIRYFGVGLGKDFDSLIATELSRGK